MIGRFLCVCAQQGATDLGLLLNRPRRSSGLERFTRELFRFFKLKIANASDFVRTWLVGLYIHLFEGFEFSYGHKLGDVKALE